MTKVKADMQVSALGGQLDLSRQETWGKSTPNAFQPAQGGDGGIEVGQLAESLPGLCLHGPRCVDPDQVRQLRVELAALEGAQS